LAHLLGHSELTATNAPVGRFVHWMGCVFFIQRRMGFITVDFFLLLTTVFLFLFFGSWPFFLDLTSHIATMFTFLPS
jgi:hypothetical protein